MKVLIIANFPDRLDGGKSKGRFLYLGEMLCAHAHNVEMIVSDFDHGKKIHREKSSITRSSYSTKITALHEPGYTNNISIKRLWSHFVWGRNVGKYLTKIEKPDVIYCAVPSLTAGVKAAKYCKKTGVRFIIDVQDLWPEAFTMALKNKIIQKCLKPIERYANIIYMSADIIVAVSNTYVQRALSVNKKVKNGLSVYLGNDGALFDEVRSKGEYINNNRFQLAYVGTLSYSYDLKCVIDALSIYNGENPKMNVSFVVMGDGPLKEEFLEYSRIKNVDCVFTGFLPYQTMVEKLSSCDIVINPIVKGSAASIINKVGDYALIGLPVINTQECDEYIKLIDDYKCGINCECGNSKEVAEAIKLLASNVELRKSMGDNSRRLGVERFDRRTSYACIINAIEDGL